MKRLLVIMAIATALIAAGFAANGGTKAITVGDFAVKVSRALGKPSGTPAVAASSLQAVGVDLGQDLGARLTERDAARIMNDLGIKTTTRTPGSSVSSAKADQLAMAIGQGSVAASAVVSQSDLPTACLQEANRGNCQTCCKVAFGCSLSGSCEFASTCANFCHQVLPPGQASPSEPPP